MTFESGRQARFDLVVGADGQHSTIRRLAFGPESQYANPVGLVIATTPVDATLVSAPDVVQMCNIPGASLSVHPAGGHPAAAFIFRAGTSRPRDREAQQRELEQRYAGRGWLSTELLAAAREAEDLLLRRCQQGVGAVLVARADRAVGRRSVQHHNPR